MNVTIKEFVRAWMNNMKPERMLQSSIGKALFFRTLIRGGPTIAVARADIATWMGVMRAAVDHMYCRTSMVKP